ncbi:MAG: transcriptional repressor LexA [Sedimentisphaerales bacterium]|nr:transcriptional repressor LexA [Sedimentisphaerales bacterium]
MQQNKAVNLTPRQLQLLETIAHFQASQPYSATIQELASQLNISRTTAFEHLAALREKGFLSACPNKARSLKLTSQGQKLLKQHRTQKTPQPILAEDTGGLPMAGRVAAGRPIEAIEQQERLSLTTHFGSTDEVFALEVVGDSMIDDGICSGDHVICRRSANAHNGQLVVAIVDDDNATVKRFYKEATQVRLEPANKNYAPIYSTNCRIEAIVVGLLRKF